MATGTTRESLIPGAPRVRSVAPPILLAIVADFFLNLLLSPARGGASIVGRALTFGAAALVALFIGRWLGERTWPKRGRAIAMRHLRILARLQGHATLVLTDRPDTPPSLTRRLVDVVGFAAGISVIVVAGLTFLGMTTLFLTSSVIVLGLAALWLSFLLVPYWMYARMGVRVVDRARWTIAPLSRRYAGRLRLSNGFLSLVAVGMVFNLLYREGASEVSALNRSITLLAHVVATVLVVAASAVAYYSRVEFAHLREFEADAIAAGLKDARGLTDEEFLPRLKGD